MNNAEDITPSTAAPQQKSPTSFKFFKLLKQLAIIVAALLIALIAVPVGYLLVTRNMPPGNYGGLYTAEVIAGLS